MRVMVFDRYGEPDVLHLKDVPIPEQQEGEVLIRVGYSSVNPADSRTRASATRVHYPYVLYTAWPMLWAAAKSGGLLVAATCGTANATYVRSLGADRVIEYNTENVCQAVRDWSAEGVDVVLDAVGPATLAQALGMLRPGAD
jgi:NADPH:quinone reductase-like Zn-dependent oxidoreductase